MSGNRLRSLDCFPHFVFAAGLMLSALQAQSQLQRKSCQVDNLETALGKAQLVSRVCQQQEACCLLLPGRHQQVLPPTPLPMQTVKELRRDVDQLTASCRRLEDDRLKLEGKLQLQSKVRPGRRLQQGIPAPVQELFIPALQRALLTAWRSRSSSCAIRSAAAGWGHKFATTWGQSTHTCPSQVSPASCRSTTSAQSSPAPFKGSSAQSRPA